MNARNKQIIEKIARKVRSLLCKKQATDSFHPFGFFFRTRKGKAKFKHMFLVQLSHMGLSPEEIFNIVRKIPVLEGQTGNRSKPSGNGRFVKQGKEQTKKKIVYIAGRVTGLPIDEVRRKFQSAEEEIICKGNIAVNPLRFVPSTASWEVAMRISLSYLLFCDAIYLLPDWRESKGARLEYYTAKQLGLEVVLKKETKECSGNIK